MLSGRRSGPREAVSLVARSVLRGIVGELRSVSAFTFKMSLGTEIMSSGSSMVSGVHISMGIVLLIR